MILHHFFVPAIINATWFNIFNGNIKNNQDLYKFLLGKRKELKYEFYLPKNKELIKEGIKVIEYSIGRELKNIDEILELSIDELYKVASRVRSFSSALSYIYEAYYISAVTTKYLCEESFTEEKFLQVAEELFTMEIEHGRIVKYPESYSIPKMKATLNYLLNLKIIQKDEQGIICVINVIKVEEMIEKFARDINDQVTINLKFGHGKK
jgi:hypothetical protein